jgi:hypothetical protein
VDAAKYGHASQPTIASATVAAMTFFMAIPQPGWCSERAKV